MTIEDFLRSARILYPDLRVDFDDLEGFIHLQMDKFRCKVELDIKARDKLAVTKAMALAVACYQQGDWQLKEAIDVSFAEAIFAGHTEPDISWAWQNTPEIIRNLHLAFWGKRPFS